MSPLQFAHLICIFENYLDELAWISFAKFETNFNPILDANASIYSVVKYFVTKIYDVYPKILLTSPGLIQCRILQYVITVYWEK